MSNSTLNDILEEIHDYGINVNDRILYLHGLPDTDQEDSGVEFRMANKFLKNILFLDKQEKAITVHQHNIGGEWQSGMVIFDAISTAKSHISVVCHGEIMSMGTVVLQSADVRYSMPNCHFMFHFGSTGIGHREYISAHSWAEIEKAQTKVMMNMYAKRCANGEFFQDKSEYQIKRFLDSKFKTKGDWHLLPEEAKYYGFIDKLIGLDCELKDI